MLGQRPAMERAGRSVAHVAKRVPTPLPSATPTQQGGGSQRARVTHMRSTAMFPSTVGVCGALPSWQRVSVVVVPESSQKHTHTPVMSVEVQSYSTAELPTAASRSSVRASAPACRAIVVDESGHQEHPGHSHRATTERRRKGHTVRTCAAQTEATV